MRCGLDCNFELGCISMVIVTEGLIGFPLYLCFARSSGTWGRSPAVGGRQSSPKTQKATSQPYTYALKHHL